MLYALCQQLSRPKAPTEGNDRPSAGASHEIVDVLGSFEFPRVAPILDDTPF